MPAYKDEQRGTWYARFKHLNYEGVSKEIWKRGFRTKKEALAWEENYKNRMKGSVQMTFRDFAEIYIEEMTPRIKESTLQTKQYTIKYHLLPYFGNKKLCDISPKDVVKWQNSLLSYADPGNGKPLSRNYIQTLHNQLSAMLNYAVKYYDLEKNSAAIAGNVKAGVKKEMSFWTLEEYQLFAAVMRQDSVYHMCFEILYWCGLREGEMLALMPYDIDLDRKEIYVNKTFHHLNGRDYVTDPKTAKSVRHVSVPDFLCEELRTYMERTYELDRNDRLFPVSKNCLTDAMKRGIKEAGLPEIRVHDLRHSHVSLLINEGFDAVAIANRVGHESIEITYRYAHMFPSEQERITTSLNRLNT